MPRVAVAGTRASALSYTAAAPHKGEHSRGVWTETKPGPPPFWLFPVPCRPAYSCGEPPKKPVGDTGTFVFFASLESSGVSGARTVTGSRYRSGKSERDQSTARPRPSSPATTRTTKLGTAVSLRAVFHPPRGGGARAHGSTKRVSKRSGAIPRSTHASPIDGFRNPHRRAAVAVLFRDGVRSSPPAELPPALPTPRMPPWCRSCRSDRRCGRQRRRVQKKQPGRRTKQTTISFCDRTGWPSGRTGIGRRCRQIFSKVI